MKKKKKLNKTQQRLLALAEADPLGKIYLDMKVDLAVKQIRTLLASDK